MLDVVMIEATTMWIMHHGEHFHQFVASHVTQDWEITMLCFLTEVFPLTSSLYHEACRDDESAAARIVGTGS